MIRGDTSDGITPYQPFGIKFIETSAYRLIEPCKTKQECLQVVVDQYKEWFLKVLSLQIGTGKEIAMTTGQWMNNIYRMIHMYNLKTINHQSFFS